MSDVPRPVTDADVRAAWVAFYTTENYAATEPKTGDWYDAHLLEQLRKVLENDRARVAREGT